MNITVSNASQNPIYEQIAEQYKKLILSQALQPGDCLPSIRSLAKALGISVITTKRAYEELEKEGYIESVAGKGSFVSKDNKEFLREKKLSILESKMMEIINEGRILNIGLQGLKMMMEVMYREA